MARKIRTATTPGGIVLLFLLPSLAGFVVFVLIPMVASLGLSFTNYSGGRSMKWVWLGNYSAAFSSPAFQRALWVTVKFVLVSVAFQLVLGLFFALILNGKLWGRGFFRSLYFVPCILSSIALSLAFAIIFNPKVGPANGLLSAMGLTPLPWLTSPRTALGTIVIVTVWQSFGYYMVLFLAGLQAINPALYESADIDGASAARSLFAITIPMLSPTTFFCVITAVIRGFQVFDQVYMLTGGGLGGGPDGSTSVLVFDVYKNGFQHLRMGYASAEATVLLLLLLAITVIQYRAQSSWVSYEGV